MDEELKGAIEQERVWVVLIVCNRQACGGRRREIAFSLTITHGRYLGVMHMVEHTKVCW